MLIEIPKYDHEKGEFEDQAPCWIPTQRSINNAEWYESKLKGIVIEEKYEYTKPTIVCNCGKACGIGLHHVHIDGTVTTSFYHKKGNGKHEDLEGCEWHVFLKLLDYDLGEFLPIKNQ